MSNKRMIMMFLPGTVAAIAAVLYSRYLQTGRISTGDVVAVLVTLGIVALVSGLTLRHVAKRQASGTAPRPMSRKASIGIAALAIFMLLHTFYPMYKKVRVGQSSRQANEDIRKNARVIRTNTGQRDVTGWVPARSTDGRFSVMMPNVFNEIVTQTARNGRTQELTALGTSCKGATFMVTTCPYEDPGKALAGRKQEALDRMKQTKGGQIKILEEGLYAERYPRLIAEAHVDANGADGLVQIVMADEGWYMVSVQGSELTEELRAMAQRFFQSFEITAPDPNAAVDPNASEAIQ